MTTRINIKSIMLLFILIVAVSMGCSSPKTEGYYYKKAKSFYDQGKFAESVVECKNAIELNNKNPETHLLLAKNLLNLGKYSEAFKELKEVVEIAPQNKEGNYLLGTIYVAAQKYDMADEIANMLINEYPNDSAGYTIKTGLYLSRGDKKNALKFIEQAVRLATPDDKQIRLKYAEILLMNRRTEDSKKVLDDLRNRFPHEIMPRIYLAGYYLLKRDVEKWDRELTSAIKIAEGDLEKKLLLQKGKTLIRVGKVREGENILKKLMEMSYFPGMEGYAGFLLDNGRVEEAGKIIELIKEQKGERSVSFLEGVYNYRIGRLKEAEKFFLNRIKNDNTNYMAHYFLALVKYRRGYITNALMELKKTLELNPDFIRARLLMSEIFLRQGDYDQAKVESERVLKNSPYVLNAAILLARALIGKKEYKEAKKVIDGIDDSVKEQIPVLLTIAELYKEKGDERTARRFYMQAVEKSGNSPQAILQYLSFLLEKGHYSRLVMEYDKYSSSLDRINRPNFMLIKAKAFAALSRYQDAEKILKECIKIKHDFVPAFHLLAGLYVKQEKYGMAKEELINLVEKERITDSYSFLMLALLYQIEGDNENSNKYYRRVLDLEPHNAIAANNLAYNLAEEGGSLDESLKYAQIAREAYPENPSVTDTLAWVYFKKGLLNLALPLIREARKSSPENQFIREHYNIILMEYRKNKNKEVKMDNSSKK